jgi:hypothetical protein
MTHPRPSVNALSSLSWSFDQDLALWQELGVHHAGLLISKIEPNRDTKIARLRAAGIRPSTLVCGAFALSSPETWDTTRTVLNSALDVVASMGGRPGGRVHLGEGELPIRRLMRDVLDAGYEGLFDLEVLGPAIEAEGYAPALRRGVDRASSLLAELGL